VWQGEDEWDEGVGVKEGQACACRAGQSSPVNRWAGGAAGAANGVTHQGCPHPSSTTSTHARTHARMQEQQQQ